MRTSFSLIPLFLSSFAFAQIDSATGKVSYVKIIELDSNYTAEKIFKISKEWFSSNIKNFNRSNSEKNLQASIWGTKTNSANVDQLYKNEIPLKLADADERKLIGRGVLKYTGSNLGCVRLLYIEYDVKVYCKNSKAKIQITNLNYTHYNPYDMKQMAMWGFSDQGPCNSKNTIESLIECDKCPENLQKFFAYLTQDVKALQEDFSTFLKSNWGSGDDW